MVHNCVPKTIGMHFVIQQQFHMVCLIAGAIKNVPQMAKGAHLLVKTDALIALISFFVLTQHFYSSYARLLVISIQALFGFIKDFYEKMYTCKLAFM